MVSVPGIAYRGAVIPRIDGERRGATLGRTAIDTANIAVGELASARGQRPVPEKLELSVPVGATEAIPVRIHHRKEEARGVGYAEGITVRCIGLGIIPRIPEHEHGPRLVLKLVGGFPRIIIGTDRDNELGGPGWTGLSPKPALVGPQQQSHQENRGDETLKKSHKSRILGSKPKDNPLRSRSNPRPKRLRRRGNGHAPGHESDQRGFGAYPLRGYRSGIGPE